MKHDFESELPTFDLHKFKDRTSKHALIIPVLNEGERIRRQLQQLQAQPGVPDIILVDGGSTDGSTNPDFLASVGVNTLIVKTGSGRLGSQLRLGLAHALKTDYAGMILIDGNDKDDPDAIPGFIEALDAGYDHIQGSRFVPGGKAINNPISRLAGIRLLHAPLISLASRRWQTDTTNGFRAYSPKLLLDERVRPFRGVFTGYELHYYLSIQAGRLGFRMTEIPVTRRYPRGEVPSKIKGLRGNLKVLGVLIDTCLGKYAPE